MKVFNRLINQLLTIIYIRFCLSNVALRLGNLLAKLVVGGHWLSSTAPHSSAWFPQRRRGQCCEEQLFFGCACLTFWAYDWENHPLFILITSLVVAWRALVDMAIDVKNCGASLVCCFEFFFLPAFSAHCGLWAFTFNLGINSYRFHEGINAVDPHSLWLIPH